MHQLRKTRVDHKESIQFELWPVVKPTSDDTSENSLRFPRDLQILDSHRISWISNHDGANMNSRLPLQNDRVFLGCANLKGGEHWPRCIYAKKYRHGMSHSIVSIVKGGFYEVKESTSSSSPSSSHPTWGIYMMNHGEPCWNNYDKKDNKKILTVYM